MGSLNTMLLITLCLLFSHVVLVYPMRQTGSLFWGQCVDKTGVHYDGEAWICPDGCSECRCSQGKIGWISCGCSKKSERCCCMNPDEGTANSDNGDPVITCREQGYCYVDCYSKCGDKRIPFWGAGGSRCISYLACQPSRVLYQKKGKYKR